MHTRSFVCFLVIFLFTAWLPVRSSEAVSASDAVWKVQVVYHKEEPKNLPEYEEILLVAENFLDTSSYLIKNFEKQLVRIAKNRGMEVVSIFVEAEQNGRFPSEGEFGRKSQVRLYYLIS
ncbi:MAG: hypothetical protein ACXIT9_08435 [Nitritalea sp.]